MGYTQNGKLLKIRRTILDDNPVEKRVDGDPLLLVKFDAVEGISRLFSYDIVLLRDSGKGIEGDNRPHLDPSTLIGTHCELGATSYIHRTWPIPDDKSAQYFRAGMFEWIEEVKSIDKVKLWPFTVRGFYIYRAHVVPWVKVLARDIHFRVFEKKTVVEILDAVARDAHKTFPHLNIDLSGLNGHHFPKMDYCVQFGESTLEFISRLMARFGIWYVFAHRTGDDDLLNETMVLYGGWVQMTSAVKDPEVNISDDNPQPSTVAKLVRRFRPPQRKTIVGGFNQLNPTKPYYHDAEVSPDFDLLWRPEGGQPDKTKWFSTTNFAEPVEGNKEAEVLATIRSDDDQSGVMSLSAVSRNPSFLPGHHFIIKSDDPDDAEGAEDLVNRAYIIDTFSLSCHDYNYENLWGWQALDLFFDTYSTVGADDSSDGALSKVSLWLSNAAQGIFQMANNPDTGQRNLDLGAALGAVTPLTAFSNPLTSALCVALMAVKVEKAAKDNADQAVYANSFIALPTTIRQGEKLRLDFPAPLWTRSLARGPQTAVVIGPDGVSTSKQQDIYADAVGRVRVRFPWDPGPPQDGDRLPPQFPVTQPDKPTKVGDNTCWLRVVEGWAGRSYGIQFLPRIGQEVLVDFLDGDPERPVITGRLYNADHGATNLPFPDPDVKDTKVVIKKTNSGGEEKELPDTAKFNLRYSGVKTWSIPTTDGQGNPKPTRFHLLRFDDTRDKEQYLIRSQRRLDITAFEKRYESIRSDRHLTVGKVGGTQSTSSEAAGSGGGGGSGGSYLAMVTDEYHLSVGKTRKTLVKKDDNLQVNGSSSELVGSNWSVTVGGPSAAAAIEDVASVGSGGSAAEVAEITADAVVQALDALAMPAQATIDVPSALGNLVLNAGFNMTLSVGASSIVLTPAAIFIQSPLIHLVGTVLGAPPVPTPIPFPPFPPKDAGAVKPKQPTLADTGDTLDPPSDPS